MWPVVIDLCNGLIDNNFLRDEIAVKALAIE
jgi:hypothetical protein